MCDVSGPDTGSIVSLNAIGKQDTYLIDKDPYKSFFKYDLKQHSNFRKFHRNTRVSRPDDDNSSWPFNKSIKVKFKPRNMGDLLSNMYVSIKMPRVSSGHHTYADQLGRHLFKSVTMRVDEIIVEKFNMDWGIIYDELYLDESEKRTKRYTLNRNVAEDASTASQGTIDLGQYDSELFIPIPFFFSRKYENDEYETNKPNRPYFPLCAIHKQEIEFEFEFQPQSFFTDEPSNLTVKEFDIITEEITIEPSERTYIKNKKYTFITDIVKKHPSLEITSDMNEANIDLVPSIPVKTINWFLRNTDFENENVSRESSQTNTTPDAEYYYQNRFNFSSSMTSTIQNEFYNPPMSSAKLYVNGEDLPGLQDSDHKYYKYIVPFTSRLSRPFRNIYTYTFSMNPVNVESSGSLDFTHLRSNRTKLNIKMKEGLTKTYTLHIYYVGYQTFTFENGFMNYAY
jgi:hypothetical protein